MESIATLRNRWIELIGESVLDSNGQKLMYWRVKRADSILVIPMVEGRLVLLNPSYRHGIQQATYDFPGGRLDEGISHEENALVVLERELHVPRDCVRRLDRLNAQGGWHVDSSFSSQHVHVFEALIVGTNPTAGNRAIQVPADSEGVSTALSLLSCLQCRCALLDWAWQKGLPIQLKRED